MHHTAGLIVGVDSVTDLEAAPKAQRIWTNGIVIVIAIAIVIEAEIVIVTVPSRESGHETVVVTTETHRTTDPKTGTMRKSHQLYHRLCGIDPQERTVIVTGKERIQKRGGGVIITIEIGTEREKGIVTTRDAIEIVNEIAIVTTRWTTGTEETENHRDIIITETATFVSGSEARSVRKFMTGETKTNELEEIVDRRNFFYHRATVHEQQYMSHILGHYLLARFKIRSQQCCFSNT
eukprot:Selendium_serpulae@DN4638_c0_g1_i1.p2